MKKIPFILLLSFMMNQSWALPEGFVYLHDLSTSILEDMRYAGSYNFMGHPINGYEAKRCILTQNAAIQLIKAQQAIARQGYRLKVYDCYRPQMAVNDFFQWSQNSKDNRMKAQFYPREPKETLFAHHYISKASGHTNGSTVDITLTRANNHQSLNRNGFKDCYDIQGRSNNDNSIDMGTRFDCLDKSAGTFYQRLTSEQKQNRLLLRQLLIRFGFKPYDKEWWHFTLKNEPYPKTFFNFPVK